MDHPTAILFLLILIFSTPCCAQESVITTFDDSAVTILLVLMDSIATRSAQYEQGIGRRDTLSPDSRAEAILELQERNRQDPVIADMINRLLALEPYRLYFERFRNVTPSDFRTAFTSLPYTAPDLPGGLADALLELHHHKEAFNAWYREIKGAMNITRCVRSAREWLPPGELSPRNIYFIYDGNAGSFAEQGNAFFNLCSEVITKTPREKRFQQMDEISARTLEGVIAHELHHVMSETILFPGERQFASWEEQWKDQITRSLVSEGVAFQCNPVTGFQKDVWEDRATIASLMKQLNLKLLELGRHSLKESEMEQWYRGLFHENATALLEQYLRRTHTDSTIGMAVREYAIFRPDLVHALGWWMVSRITENGTRKERAIQMLSRPSSLYHLYNQTLSKEMEDIAVYPEVVAGFLRDSD